MRRTLALLLLALLLAPAARAESVELSDPVVIRVAAVAETATGFVGSTASITITAAANGSGHVFLDTFPLTEVDMQGSARLAARVAAQTTGKDLQQHDLFFVVRSGSQQIGGPSAGAAMTVGAIAALMGWEVRDDVAMTGTINPDATVGPVGGIAEKAAASASVGVRTFLFPAGQEVVPLGTERVVNLTRYCAQELQIECIPVVDVIDAVNVMTDHHIERPALTGNVTGEDYLARLAPLSRELVDAAATRVDEADRALALAPSGAARDTLAERLAGARGTLARAEGAAANGSYYTASSLSFQAGIEARYVREASGYLAATDRAVALAASLRESEATVARVRGEVEAARIEDTNAFETVGAAQVRILEAEERSQDAASLAENATGGQAVFDALYQAAYAAERAETAAWWLRLSEGFPRGARVPADGLEELARDTLTTSREEVAYVEAVLAGGDVGVALDASRAQLADAERAMERGFHAAALLEALEASVRAAVILEVTTFGGDVPISKYETARVNAARAIQGARERGVESLLAQSAYEFGLSLDQPVERLSFLGVARVTANLAGLPGLFAEGARPAETRFQGVPDAVGVPPVYVAAAFAVGLALGVGAGLAALMPRAPSAPRGPTAPGAQGGDENEMPPW